MRSTNKHCLKLLLQILLYALLGTGSTPSVAQSNFYSSPVPWGTVDLFQNTRCALVSSDTLLLQSQGPKPYPTSFRTDLPSKLFTPEDGTIPFEIYYAASRDSQLYLIQHGFCRNFTTLVPIPRPGWYFVRYYHQGKPALVQINALEPRITVKCNGLCEIHD